MVENLSQRASQNGFVHFEVAQMDAEVLDCPDETFDVVLCSLGLIYVPDPGKAVREMHRVLVPGGRAAVVVWGRRDRCGWAELFPIVDRRVKSDVCPLFFQLGTGDMLAHTFESAGFADITTERFSLGLPFNDAKEACEAAFWGGAVALAW